MTYGFLARNDTNSSFNNGNQELPLLAPSLNISAYSTDYSCPLGGGFDNRLCTFGASWQDPRSHDYPFQGLKNVAYTLSNSNATYDVAKIQAEGTCQQLETYQWGFSFLLLFVVMLFTAVWALGSYALWMDAYLNSRLERSPRDMGTLRAILDYAAAIEKDLGADTIKNTGNRALKARMRLNGERQMIRSDALDEMELPLSRSAEFKIWWRAFDVRAWVKQEKLLLTIWSLSSCGFVATASGFLATRFLFVLWLLPIFETTMTMIARPPKRSRWTVQEKMLLTIWLLSSCGFVATAITFSVEGFMFLLWLLPMFGATMTMIARPPKRSRWAIFTSFSMLGYPLLFFSSDQKTAETSETGTEMTTAANTFLTDP